MRTMSLSRVALAAVALSILAGCADAGQPMDFPTPQSELGSRPGVFTGDSGEWTVYRR